MQDPETSIATKTEGSRTTLLLSSTLDQSEKSLLISENLEFSNANNEIDVRFLVLGCSRVGKSSLLKRVCYSGLVKNFSEIKKYESIEQTKGIELHLQLIASHEDQHKIKVIPPKIE